MSYQTCYDVVITNKDTLAEVNTLKVDESLGFYPLMVTKTY